MSYNTFFELIEKPFQLSPDPEYFFPSEVHKEVMRHLMYSISTDEGFVEITGEPGMGKTITVRTLLMQIGEELQVSMIVDPKITPQELINTVAQDFGLKTTREQSNEKILRLLQKHLIDLSEQGVASVIIIDEAQNLSDETLEQLCLISNIETEKQKLVKVILVGQLELSRNLKRPELLKIYQRITIRHRLSPLSKADTIAYIHHRIRVAGGSGSTQPWFSERVFNKIFAYSNGLPRLINIICDRSLMAASVEKSRMIKHVHVKKALNSFMDEDSISRYYKQSMRLQYGGIIVAILLVVCLAFFFFRDSETQQPLTIAENSAKTDIPQIPIPQPELDNKTNESIHIEKSKVFAHEQKTVTVPTEKQLTVNQAGTISAQPDASTRTEKIRKEPKEAQKEAVQNNWLENFPLQLLTCASSEKVVVYCPDMNRLLLWQIDSKKATLLKEYPFVASLREGIYIYGKDKSKKPFVFNPYVAKGIWTDKLSEKMSGVLNTLDAGQVMFLLVYLSDKSFDKPCYAESKHIYSLVHDWVSAWQAKEISHFLEFYQQQPLIYYFVKEPERKISWENFKQSKKNTFSRASSIDITVDHLITGIDPGNPKQAMALFSQAYTASNYSDSGIKCMFLNQVYEDDMSARWLFSGRFWMPLDKRVY